MRFSAWLQLGVLLPAAALGALSSASAALPAREPPLNFNVEETVEALQHRLRDLRIEDAGGSPEVEQHAIFLDAREYRDCVDSTAIAPRIKKPLPPAQPLLSRRDVEEGRRFAASRHTWCRLCRRVLTSASICAAVFGVQYFAGREIQGLCQEPPISAAKTERFQQCWGAVAIASAAVAIVLAHGALFLCLFVPAVLYPRHLYEGLRFLEAREDKNIRDGVRLRLVCRGRSDLHEDDDILQYSSSSWEIAAAAAGGPASTGPRDIGSRIEGQQPRAQVRLAVLGHRVGYVRVKEISDCDGEVGLWPDILYPLGKAKETVPGKDIGVREKVCGPRGAKDKSLLLWFDVFREGFEDEDAAAGWEAKRHVLGFAVLVLRFVMESSDDNAVVEVDTQSVVSTSSVVEKRIPVRLWPFSLPDRSRFRTTFGIHVRDPWWRQKVDLGLQHRVSFGKGFPLPGNEDLLQPRTAFFDAVQKTIFSDPGGAQSLEPPIAHTRQLSSFRIGDDETAESVRGLLLPPADRGKHFPYVQPYIYPCDEPSKREDFERCVAKTEVLLQQLNQSEKSNASAYHVPVLMTTMSAVATEMFRSEVTKNVQIFCPLLNFVHNPEKHCDDYPPYTFTNQRDTYNVTDDAEVVATEVVKNQMQGIKGEGEHQVRSRHAQAAGGHARPPAIEQAQTLWWYISCMSQGCDMDLPNNSHSRGCVNLPCRSGWPSYMVDTLFERNRKMGVLAYLYDIRGELYWEVDQFNASDIVLGGEAGLAGGVDPDMVRTGEGDMDMEGAKRGVPRRERDDDGGGADVLHFGGNGDGQLLYPDNRGGQTNASVPSVRLKHIRDGLEDLEYLFLLEDAVRAPAAQQQNGPAANQQAQPVPQYGFPLFENARTMQVLHKSFADVEFKKVAKRAQRSVNSLAVNVWDLCLAKKTGLTQGIHSPVKTKILSFMGDEPPATVYADLSAARLLALSNRTQDEFVKCVAEFLTKKCEQYAVAGNKSCNVTFSEMRADFIEKRPRAGIKMHYPEPVAPAEEGGAKKGAEEESVLTLIWYG
eukprot:g2886.t1